MNLPTSLISSQWLLFLVISSACAVYNYDAREPFHKLTYDTVRTRLQDLRRAPHIYKVDDLYELYHGMVTKDMCGSEYCVNPIIELFDFENSTNRAKKMPTVLILAGLDGSEHQGVNTAMDFMFMIRRNRTRNPLSLMLLNNIRVLVVPMADPLRYYKTTTGKTDGAKLDDMSYPQIDFNWNQKSKCFVSRTSQVLNLLFKDNLIISVLWLRGDDQPSISFPNDPTGQLHTSDELMMQKIAKMMGETTEKNVNGSDPTFKVKLEDQVDSSHYRFENFSNWVFRGSNYPDRITRNCLPSDSHYSQAFTEINKISNKALIFKVDFPPSEIGAGGIPQLGNILGVMDKSNHEARQGPTTQGILMVMQYLEAMRPYARLRKIYRQYSATNVMGTLILDIDIRGCRQVSSIKIRTPMDLEQSFVVKPVAYLRNTKSISAELRVEIDIHQQMLWRNPVDFTIDIDCDSDFENMTANLETVSHFYRARTDPTFELKYKEFKLQPINLQGLRVLNIKHDVIQNALIFQKYHGEVELVYNSRLVAETTTGHYIDFYYDRDRQLMTYKPKIMSESTLKMLKASNSNLLKEVKSMEVLRRGGLLQVDSSGQTGNQSNPDSWKEKAPEQPKHSVNHDNQNNYNDNPHEVKYDPSALRKISVIKDYDTKVSIDQDKFYKAIQYKNMVVYAFQEVYYFTPKITPKMRRKHSWQEDSSYNGPSRRFSESRGGLAPYVALKIGEPKLMTETAYLNLVGKRLMVESNNPFEKKKYAEYYKGIIRFSRVPDLGSMLVPSEGLYCISQNEYNFHVNQGSTDRLIFFEASSKSNDKLHVKIHIQGEFKTKDILVQGRDINFTAHRVNEDWDLTPYMRDNLYIIYDKKRVPVEYLRTNYARFEMMVDRINFEALGVVLVFYNPSDPTSSIGACVPERSMYTTVSNTARKTMEEMRVRRNEKDLVQVIDFASHEAIIDEMKFPWLLVSLSLLGVGAVGLGAWCCCHYWRKRLWNYNRSDFE